MLTANELIDEAISLPVELRGQLIEKLLKSLNPLQDEIDRLWAVEAERRVAEIESEAAQTTLGEEVFRKLRKRLN